jgi:hypothetical protein
MDPLEAVGSRQPSPQDPGGGRKDVPDAAGTEVEALRSGLNESPAHDPSPTQEADVVPRRAHEDSGQEGGTGNGGEAPDLAGQPSPPADSSWSATQEAKPSEAGSDQRPWWRHPNERWVVGDEGQAPRVRSLVPKLRESPPEILADGGEVGSIVYRAASVRGLGHQEKGSPRQDACLVRFTSDRRWLVACLADGVSEGSLSHLAAELVCDALSDVIVEEFDRIESAAAGSWSATIGKLPWSEAVDRANDAVRARFRTILERKRRATGASEDEEAAAEVPSDARVRHTMSATAMVLVAGTQPAEDGRYPVALANVAGDSAAFAMFDGQWDPISAIKNEGASVYSGAVRSLPVDVAVQPKAYWFTPETMLVMMTDGLGDPLGMGKGVVAAFLAEKWAAPPDVLAFVSHLSFYRRSFADDRTAVAVWFEPGPVRAP